MVIIKYDYGYWVDINYLYLRWDPKLKMYDAMSIEIEDGKYVTKLIFERDEDAMAFKLKYG